MDLVQHMWEYSTLLADPSWSILVLLPEGNMDTSGIGMLEVLWKVVEEIIYTQINMVVTFHDILN